MRRTYKHKRIISLILSAVLIFGMIPTAFATESAPAETTAETTSPVETTIPVVETTSAAEETTSAAEETTSAAEETTVPETTESVAETTTETTVPEETGEKEKKPVFGTAPVEKTPCEKLLAAESTEELYIIMLDMMNNSPEDLMNLTAEEIESIRARVAELDPESDDTDTADILDTLAMLPNGEGELDGDPEILDLAATQVASVSDNITMYLFDYGSEINYGDPTFEFFGRYPNNQTTNPTGDMHQVDSVMHGAVNEDRPVMSKTLVDGYPHVTSIGTNTGKQGSLKSLFYLDGSDFVKGNGTADSWSKNETSYKSMRWKVGDSNGTGLFRKNADGYYYYSSSLNSAYFNGTKFELYNYLEVPSYYDPNTSLWPEDYGKTQLQELPDGRLDVNSLTTDTAIDEMWNKVRSENFLPFGAAHVDGKTVEVKGNRQGDVIYRQKNTDTWFGMYMEFDFYMPEDGKINNKDMVFEFLGDDDVYVYIDDVLVLDIGNDHYAEYGTINFQNGVAKYPTYAATHAKANDYDVTNLRALFSAAGADMSDFKEGTNTFKPGTKHNLKFYYLERGSLYSYCSLNFNIIPVPTANISVEKQVEGINPSFADDQTYNFKINASHSNSAVNLNTISYDLFDKTTNTTTEGLTVANGSTFALKHNQVALFDLQDEARVTFMEQDNPNATLRYWTKNGTEVGNGNTVIIPSVEQGQEVKFVCTNIRHTGDLSITKAFDGTQFEPSKQFEMNINVGKPETAYSGEATIARAGGSTENITITGGKVNLAVGDTVTIADIPTGYTYSITETDPNVAVDSAYAFGGTTGYPKYTNCTGSIAKDTTSAATVTNAHQYTSLIITKDVDGAMDDGQVFMFRIEGNDVGKNANINQIFAISGEGSVTIPNLPVGYYTITELTDWSWRYTLQSVVDADTTIVSVTDGGKVLADVSGNTVTFTNKRTEDQWLDGNAYVENKFN